MDNHASKYIFVSYFFPKYLFLLSKIIAKHVKLNRLKTKNSHFMTFVPLINMCQNGVKLHLPRIQISLSCEVKNILFKFNKNFEYFCYNK